MPAKKEIKILYEDANILALDKPAGVAVHQDDMGRIKEKTITNFILENYPKIKNVGEPGETLRPGIVHRLDKDTSGVLLVAKNQKTFEFLKEQFQNRKLKKTYRAIVSGSVKNNEGKINQPIGRSPSNFMRRLAGRGARGELREAITEYKVLKRFEDKKGNKFSYVEVYPKTGRTHQIRVHFKYLNYPVACDLLYSPGKACPPGISRLALHAFSIEFVLPNGKKIKIESPLSKDLEKASLT